MQKNKELPEFIKTFKKIRGLTWDFYYTKTQLEFNFNGSEQAILRKIGKKIKNMFLNPGICEDLIFWGSADYGGATATSDIDLIGINRKNRKNRKYHFYVKNNNKVTPVTIRIENGQYHYPTRFRYKRFPEYPQQFLNVKIPRCWGFVPKKIFLHNTLLYKQAQLDVIECVAATIQTMFYKTKSNEIIITPQKLTEELKNNISKTRQKKLFNNNRLERGLKKHFIENIQDTLNFCDFWAKPIGNNRYKIKKIGGLKGKKNFHNKFFALIFSVSPFYIAYLIDKKRFGKIIPKALNDQK
jgi:hypothetical protein